MSLSGTSNSNAENESLAFLDDNAANIRDVTENVGGAFLIHVKAGGGVNEAHLRALSQWAASASREEIFEFETTTTDNASGGPHESHAAAAAAASCEHAPSTKLQSKNDYNV